ncbi:HAD-IC family P-type ATPase [Streptomyces sp. NPDC014733]|uniref:HAD-IC family P-type ATPase n=1 Tax=Streptomyces sp. NPDC014733 TaxID=3364885 RepID=UPI003702C4B3
MEGRARRPRGASRRGAGPDPPAGASAAPPGAGAGRGAAADRCPDEASVPHGSAGGGLSSRRAAALLAEVGPNTVPERKVGLAARAARKLWAPVPWMLEATFVLEVALGKWPDAAIVATVLVLNAALSLVQEGRARSAVALLRRRLAVDARVCRDGVWALRPAAELVPGDLAHVRAGDLVPADLRLVEGNVLMDRSTLTGEAVPEECGPGATAYSGATVVRGEATGEVVATGARTYFGRTAELVGTARSADHLAAVVLRMVRVFIAVDLVLAAAGSGYLAATGGSGQDVLSYAMVLLLASVPVALPAAFALAGTLGAQHLAGRGILTTRLSAVQEAAGMDVLCVDKTGTLTENRLTVAEVAARPPAAPTGTDVLRLAAGACDAATQDPIDLAILRAAAAHGLPGSRRADVVPFDPVTRRSEATVHTEGGPLRVAKGAPRAIAGLVGLPVDPRVERLAAAGARVLAVATRPPGDRWRPAGLVALTDPPRPDAPALIARLTGLGVRVVMLTGDGAATAAAIADRIGLHGPTARARDLRSGGADETRVAAVAEVLPEDKHHLVQRLQAAGHTVGMTGDGVNDAPALRQAEVGIAVAGATDVAKSAAGAVLTRQGLDGIVDLVRESRRIHQRLLTYALNVSVKKIEVPLLLAIGVFAWRQFVFTPLLMVLLLLGNDVVSMAITTDRADHSRRPDRWSVRATVTGALVVAGPLLAVSVGLLWTGRDVWPRLDPSHLRTLAFLTLVVSSQAGLLLVRSRRHAWTSRPGRWVLAASAGDIAAALVLALTGTLMAPLPAASAVLALTVVAAGALVADLVKVPAFTALGLHRMWRPRPPP